MTLKEHYKFHSRKSLKPYKILIFLIVFFAIIFYAKTDTDFIKTYGKYLSTSNGNNSVELAKWLLEINGEELSSNASSLSSPIQLVNVADGTNNIDVGDECYFDIIINPSSTEVAVNYTIDIDLTDADTTLPSGTTIKKYEKYNVGTSGLISTTNVNSTYTTISGDINLTSLQTGLSSSDAVKYRIYCKMPNFANLVKDSSLTVVPRITAQQKIDSN